MTQPNFLQVANSLRFAVTFCEEHPGYRSSERYHESLRAARDYFAKATLETDHLYTRWRQLLGEELKQFRDARLAYDRAAALADEHAYDAFPRRKIVYTDRELLLTLLRETVAFLDGEGDTWPWLKEQSRILSDHIQEAQRRRKLASVMYDSYVAAVKARVTAYNHAVPLVREYVSDARPELNTADDFSRVEIDVRG